MTDYELVEKLGREIAIASFSGERLSPSRRGTSRVGPTLTSVDEPLKPQHVVEFTKVFRLGGLNEEDADRIGLLAVHRIREEISRAPVEAPAPNLAEVEDWISRREQRRSSR